MSVDDGLEESAMDRGVRLEDEALEAFEKATGKIVDKVGFIESDESEFMGCSPDGLIENKGVFDEAVEIKCLSSANYVKAWVEGEVPKEYWPQVIQLFIVNENLKHLYFVLYDPRITVHPLHVIGVKRELVEEDIESYKKQEIDFINEVNSKIQELIDL